MLKIIKEEKGVSLVLLAVVIIVMLILFTVTFNTSKDLIETTKAKKYATVMYLLQGEIVNRQDEALFISDDPINDPKALTVYLGTKMSSKSSVIEEKLDDILKVEVNTTEYNMLYNKYDYSPNSQYNIVKNYWFVITKDDLEKVGIETDFVNNDENVFLVNYMTGEIIYTPGIEIELRNEISNGVFEERTTKVYTLRTFENM